MKHNYLFFSLVAVIASAILLPLFGHAAVLDLQGIDVAVLATAAGLAIRGGDIQLTAHIKSVMSQVGVHQEDYAAKPLHTETWEALRDTRRRLVESNGKLLAKIAETRGADEVKKLEDAWDFIDCLIVNITHEMDKRNDLGNRGPRNLRSGREAGAFASQKHDGPLFRDLTTGKEVRGYRHDQSMAGSFPDLRRPEGRFGDLVASIVRGKPVTPEIEQEFRTMSIGTPGAGGYAVPDAYSLQFIDLARAESRVMQAGAITVPMETNTLAMARITDDPTPEWKSENAASTASDVTIDRVTFTARTVRALLKGSQELFMDSPNIGDIVQTALVRSMGVEMDRVALVGSGVAPEPQGIYLASDVQTQNNAGGTSTYSMISQAVQKVRTENFEPNAMIAHPRTYGVLDRLVDSQLQPLMPPKSFNDLKHYPTTGVPINLEGGASPNDLSLAFVGKFNELMIGKRLELGMLVSSTASDASSNALSNYQIMILVVARMDVQIARPKAFCVVSNIND